MIKTVQSLVIFSLIFNLPYTAQTAPGKKKLASYAAAGITATVTLAFAAYQVYLKSINKIAHEHQVEIEKGSSLTQIHQKIFLPGTPKRAANTQNTIGNINTFDFIDTTNNKCSIEFGSYHPKTNPACKKTAIVFFGGNAMDSMIFTPQLQKLSDESQTIIFTMNFPGFGNSEGKASFDNAINSADTFIKKLKTEGYKNVIPMGWSFGSSIAAKMSQQHQTEAVCLISPFTSAQEISRETAPRFLAPVIKKIVDADTLNTRKVIASTKHPMSIHIIHGTKDRMVSFKNAEALLASGNHNPFIEINLHPIEKGNHFTPVINDNLTIKPYKAFIETVRKINQQEKEHNRTND
jgi:pimeloyl-ACP methyl ester carboxylesterase